MYLKKSTNKKTGRTQLTIAEGYRSDGKVKTRVIKNLGYLDLLYDKYPDPIAHFTEVAKQMTREKQEAEKPVTIEMSMTKKMTCDTDRVRNLGYLAASKIYHELEIGQFLSNRQKQTKAEYNINSIFRALVFSRLISPDSKKGSYEGFGHFFDKCDFSLEDVYRSLDIFKKYQSDLQVWLHEHIRTQYGRDTSLVYYDVTNYYFEVDKEDEMKRRGVSKEHRPDPIVQMGLFMDTNGLPITYGLFSGNTLDKQTLIPMMGEITDKYSLGKIIVVADRGMITGDNIAQTITDGNGYVFSFSVRGSDKAFKEYVLDESDYRRSTGDTDGFKIKSRQFNRRIHVTNPLTQKKQNITVEEKQVVFWSPEYAAKTKHERERTLEKSRDLIAHPEKYSRATGYGAAKYVKNAVFDKETGEIVLNKGTNLSLNEDIIREEEKYDGYYAIVTSEYDKTDNEILNIYRGLWEIEETFKITKSELETRPVYVRKTEHIQAHFLICFTALVIARLLEYRIKRKYSVKTILESLRRCNCSLIESNVYMGLYYDDVLRTLGENLGIDFSRKYRTLKDIKTELAGTKKPTSLI